MDETIFKYTVTVPDVAGSHSFEGILRDSDFNSHTIGGDSSVTVRRVRLATPRRSGNRSPEFTEGAGAVRSVAEASTSGSDVGAPVTALDPDDNTLTYSLRGTDRSSFDIDRGTGQITIANGTNLDYETKDTYTVIVRARDPSGATDTITVTIIVTNVDESGSVTLSSLQPQVGTELTATLADPDGSISSITWLWESSLDQSTWAGISGATSATYGPVASDMDSYLRLTATYTDAEGPGKAAQTESANVVQAAPNAPEFPSETGTRSVAENTAAGKEVGAPVTGTDADNDRLTYTLGGPDAASFGIDASTGQLKTKAPLDYERRSGFTVTVTATDPSGASDTTTVTIMVKRCREKPSVCLAYGEYYAKSALVYSAIKVRQDAVARVPLPSPSGPTCPTGTTTSGPSLAGDRISPRVAGSWMSWSSHSDSSSLGRITGIRSWMGLRRSLAAMVIMVQERTISPCGSRHASHSPAKAKGSPGAITIRMGRLPEPFLSHS